MNEQLSAPVRMILVNEDLDRAVVVEYPHRESRTYTGISDWFPFTFSTGPYLNSFTTIAWTATMHHDRKPTEDDMRYLDQWATAEIWIGERPDWLQQEQSA